LLVEHFQTQKQFFNKDVNEGKIIRMPNNFIPLIRGDEHIVREQSRQESMMDITQYVCKVSYKDL
jgi:hypothetical protein